mgnify:CR=1 FL=1
MVHRTTNSAIGKILDVGNSIITISGKKFYYCDLNHIKLVISVLISEQVIELILCNNLKKN